LVLLILVVFITLSKHYYFPKLQIHYGLKCLKNGKKSPL
jgi:hypothetical protein